jgi:hypothetical protein
MDSMNRDSLSDPPPRGAARKDRLIQTRVPRDLEATLKHEAQRRRLSVSHLIRSVLEDTFQLVDGVVTDVDQLVTDSVHLARNVRRNARRIGSADRERETLRSVPRDDLSHVYAWNELVLHRETTCSCCGTSIARGERGFSGLSDDPQALRVWLCGRCVGEL